MRSCDKATSSSEPTSDSPQFCPAATYDALLAVLGIFTIDEHHQNRREIRSTWLASPPAAIRVYFVLHGLGALTRTIEEARAQQDMVFLRARARLPCMFGQLQKQFLWLRCAPSAWPSASLIGKADDDAWVHLADVEHALFRTIGELNVEHTRAPPLLYWGTMESYHWDLEMRRPVGFCGARFAFRRLPAGSLSGSDRFEHCLRRLAPNSSGSSGELLRTSRELPRMWLTDPSTIAASGSIVGPFPWATGT